MKFQFAISFVICVLSSSLVFHLPLVLLLCGLVLKTESYYITCAGTEETMFPPQSKWWAYDCVTIMNSSILSWHVCVCVHMWYFCMYMCARASEDDLGCCSSGTIHFFSVSGWPRAHLVDWVCRPASPRDRPLSPSPVLILKVRTQ